MRVMVVQVEAYHHGYPTSGVPAMTGDHSSLNFTPGVLTFTPTNWNAPQTVTVDAVDDEIAQGFRRPTVQFRSASADARYHRLPDAFESVVANVTEDDTATLSVSRLVVSATEQAGCRRVQVHNKVIEHAAFRFYVKQPIAVQNALFAV